MPLSTACQPANHPSEIWCAQWHEVSLAACLVCVFILWWWLKGQILWLCWLTTHPPSNNRPTCWWYSFQGLGYWFSKIPFPELTHFLCYMGSNWAIHSRRRKPWNFPPKHRANWSSVMPDCRTAKDLRHWQPATCFKLMVWLYKTLLCLRLPLVARYESAELYLLNMLLKCSVEKQFIRKCTFIHTQA